MTDAALSALFGGLCLALGAVFAWSTVIVAAGLLKPARRHPHSSKKLRFAVLVCARNEESVIRNPVKSVLMSRYPADRREVIVLADNCTDATAERARAAGATVWEKTEPSSGKGDVLAWGIARLVKRGGFDAVAVFDADNIVAGGWLDAMNDALQDGESVATGRRFASNAGQNIISGWYTVYWEVMNELSNRVRTNLGLSGKLTGTGFAFLPASLGPDGWKTCTMVEDVEFTVQTNLRGGRVAYVPEACYADEQPTTVRHMWRQLRRWATGGWQVVRGYSTLWARELLRSPSLRLFDSFFAVLTGISVSFAVFINIAAFVVLCCCGADAAARRILFGAFMFVFVASWLTSLAAVALSSRRRRPGAGPIATFPLFSLVLSSSVISALVRPARRWLPIPHGAR